MITKEKLTEILKDEVIYLADDHHGDAVYGIAPGDLEKIIDKVLKEKEPQFKAMEKFEDAVFVGYNNYKRDYSPVDDPVIKHFQDDTKGDDPMDNGRKMFQD